MGSGLARHVSWPLRLGAALTVIAGGIAHSPQLGHAWSRCHDRDGGCPRYLNVETKEGTARLTVDRSCRSGWRHRWGRADARQTIRQWLHGDAANGRGNLCIKLANSVDQIRITSLGGHCGYEDGEANTPGPDTLLKRGRYHHSGIAVAGCHARMGTVRFGGVALNFADGYGFGDTYAAGHFYGVYDGFKNRAVGRTGASVWQISKYNTFHYRVEILARGSANWARPDDDNGR